MLCQTSSFSSKSITQWFCAYSDLLLLMKFVKAYLNVSHLKMKLDSACQKQRKTIFKWHLHSEKTGNHHKLISIVLILQLKVIVSYVSDATAACDGELQIKANFICRRRVCCSVGSNSNFQLQSRIRQNESVTYQSASFTFSIWNNRNDKRMIFFPPLFWKCNKKMMNSTC